MLALPRLLFLLALLTLSLPAWHVQAKASLYLTKDALHLEKDRRGGSVELINRGTRTGVFEVRWIDHLMQDDGSLQTFKAELSPWSLQPYVRYSPRRVTLRPGQSQRIKVAFNRRAADAPAKELFSHLNVITINDDLEQTLAQGADDNGETASLLRLNARLGISIPVIWQNAIAPAAAELALRSGIEGQQVLEVRRLGQASLRGYVHFLTGQENRAPAAPSIPLVIYPNLSSRQIALPKELASTSALEIIYSTAKSPDARDSKILARWRSAD